VPCWLVGCIWRRCGGQPHRNHVCVCSRDRLLASPSRECRPFIRFGSRPDRDRSTIGRRGGLDRHLANHFPRAHARKKLWLCGPNRRLSDGGGRIMRAGILWSHLPTSGNGGRRPPVCGPDRGCVVLSAYGSAGARCPSNRGIGGRAHTLPEMGRGRRDILVICRLSHALTSCTLRNRHSYFLRPRVSVVLRWARCLRERVVCAARGGKIQRALGNGYVLLASDIFPLNLIVWVGLIGFWAFPLGAGLWRPRARTHSEWPFLGTAPRTDPSLEPPLRLLRALLIGAAGGLAAGVALPWLRLPLPLGALHDVGYPETTGAAVLLSMTLTCMVIQGVIAALVVLAIPKLPIPRDVCRLRRWLHLDCRRSIAPAG